MLALVPSNTDWEAEGGAKGDTVAAFPSLCCGLDLSLARDSENHRTEDSCAYIIECDAVCLEGGIRGRHVWRW